MYMMERGSIIVEHVKRKFATRGSLKAHISIHTGENTLILVKYVISNSEPVKICRIVGPFTLERNLIKVK